MTFNQDIKIDMYSLNGPLFSSATSAVTKWKKTLTLNASRRAPFKRIILASCSSTYMMSSNIILDCHRNIFPFQHIPAPNSAGGWQ